MSDYQKGAIQALKDMRTWHIEKRNALPITEEYMAQKMVHDEAIHFLQDEIGRKEAALASDGPITSGG